LDIDDADVVYTGPAGAVTLHCGKTLRRGQWTRIAAEAYRALQATDVGRNVVKLDLASVSACG
jgi:hypothetical protein